MRELDLPDAGRKPAVQPTVIPIEPRPVGTDSDAAQLAERVQQVARGGVRAAVLGVNDGLVTNVCLILTMAGANASRGSVRLAGFASLIAGALSMAAGEWVSVRSQVELFESLIAQLRGMLTRNPKLVLDELADHLEAAGFGRETARAATTEIPLDEPRFMRFATTTLFGINPDELGSPLTAAGSSMFWFALGALVPLLPWFFTGRPLAVWLSVVLTGVASLVVGGELARRSDRSPVRGAARQLAIVVAAAAVTYGIGRLFGTVVG
ncbi:MAG TPA: VIT1/CCC1 transporter family protein [Acidimicrobiales bacterium]|nr:VIT1/CCC1 transporter family protein [Acidimicrobiales bacterium]